MHPSASFRLSTPQRTLPAALGFLAGIVLLQIGLALAGDAMPPVEVGQMIGWSCFAVAVVALASRRRGVILTEGALVVRNGARRRRIPRDQIERLEVRRVLGVRQVVVRTKDGRSRVLPAPNSFRDAQFEAKTRELTKWWQARR